MALPGYEIVVVGYNGRNRLSRSQTFRLYAPDTKVTVQLIGPHGLYAGPVILGGTATRPIVGLKVEASVNLGTIALVPARGSMRT